MARYIQRISLLGKERWIGWEVDGVGTEVPGLVLADDLSEDELRARGIKEFQPMTFEAFLGMNASANANDALLDEDIEFRLDALQVSMERIRSRGQSAVPRDVFRTFFGDDDKHFTHPRVIKRLLEWEARGVIEFVGSEECFLRIVGRF